MSLSNTMRRLSDSTSASKSIHDGRVALWPPSSRGTLSRRVDRIGAEGCRGLDTRNPSTRITGSTGGETHNTCKAMPSRAMTNTASDTRRLSPKANDSSLISTSRQPQARLSNQGLGNHLRRVLDRMQTGGVSLVGTVGGVNNPIG